MLTASNVAGGGDNISVNDLEGCLVVLEAVGPENVAETVRGPAPYIPARVLVVKGAEELKGGWHELWIFPKVLLGMVRRANGQALAGTIGKGTAKAGQSAPWVLIDADPTEMAEAQAVYDAATKPQLAAPSATAAPAAPAAPAGITVEQAQALLAAQAGQQPAQAPAPPF